MKEWILISHVHHHLFNVSSCMLQSELMSNFVASKTFYEQINSVNCKEFSKRPASEVRERTVGWYAALVLVQSALWDVLVCYGDVGAILCKCAHNSCRLGPVTNSISASCRVMTAAVAVLEGGCDARSYISDSVTVTMLRWSGSWWGGCFHLI